MSIPTLEFKNEGPRGIQGVLGVGRGHWEPSAIVFNTLRMCISIYLLRGPIPVMGCLNEPVICPFLLPKLRIVALVMCQAFQESDVMQQSCPSGA